MTSCSSHVSDIKMKRNVRKKPSCWWEDDHNFYKIKVLESASGYYQSQGNTSKKIFFKHLIFKFWRFLERWIRKEMKETREKNTERPGVVQSYRERKDPRKNGYSILNYVWTRYSVLYRLWVKTPAMNTRDYANRVSDNKK